ncbi:MAG: glycosyltransferase family 2 protein [Patescibacteria group bacterium]|jgi:hypothetical protein
MSDNQLKVRGADPKVSFVTVCYRTPGLVRMLLKGIEAADLKFDYEYILVNNAPGDGTTEMVKEKFPWVQVIDSPRNVGFGAGNNIALKIARGTYAMLTNPDLTVFSGELEKLVKFMDDHADVALCGPALLNPDGERQDSCYRFPTPMYAFYRRSFLGKLPSGRRYVNHFLMRDARLTERPSEVDVLMASAIMLRRSALNEIGLFDEKFFMYLEEMDLCRRAWEKKWRVVYIPHAKLVHYHQRESNIDWPWRIITNRPARAHIASALYYFRKYWGKQHPHLHPRQVD